MFLEVKNINKSFGTYQALDNVSFDIKKGQIAALIGPNGSGKSTLVKIITGLEKADKGEVYIDGKLSYIHRSHIGYVPQRYEVDYDLPMTVKEFLRLVACGTGEHEKQEAIASVLKSVGMEGFEAHQLGRLSGGQLQRILIARAIVHEKSLLILDEPSAAIDSNGEQEIYQVLDDINKTYGTTILLISHEMDVVSQFADYVIYINRSVVSKGDIHTVLEDYNG